MRLATLGRVFAIWFALILVVAIALRWHLGFEPVRDGQVIVSTWQRAERIGRRIERGSAKNAAARDSEPASRVTVRERVVAEGPVLAFHRLIFCFSFGNGRDGVHARYAGRDAYLTHDDLVRAGAYGNLRHVAGIALRCGIDPDKALALLNRELGTTDDELWQKATFTRLITHTETPASAERPVRVTREALRSAGTAAAEYLARNLDPDGHFRYEVDVRDDRASAGYNWPRHGGATLFLAEAAGYTGSPELVQAARLAARRLAEQATLSCGKYRCIGEDDSPDLGSSALALLAYVEIVKSGVDDSFRTQVRELADFLRSMQRKDGEFMHVYDRTHERPIDIQYAYYTGEAALALARSYALTGNSDDLQAAKAALAYTVRRWSFFGSRYYFDYEHWTCQAMAELWERAPDRGALDLCVRWHRFNRAMQLDSNLLGPFDGGFGDPLTPPRLAPAGSRTEGAVATLRILRNIPGQDAEVSALTRQIDRAMLFMLRHQFTPGPVHLFANPPRVYGAFPGSAVDYVVRIDYPQHVGASMLRYAEMIPQ